MPYYQKHHGDATARGRQAVVDQVRAMCKDQGVDPRDTPSEEFIKKWMMISHAEMNMITLIGSGYPVRGAQAILRAIEMKLDRHPTTVKKSAGDAANTGVTITVKTEGPKAKTVSASLPQEMADLVDAEDEEKVN